MRALYHYAIIALALSALGGILKLYGGAKYGSQAVLVDGITCIANLIAGIAVIIALRHSEKPADYDHPFGHQKYEYTGILATLIIYSIAAGFSLAILLLQPGEQPVRAESSLYAILGGAAYGGSIIAVRRAGQAGQSLSMFTASEILESGVSATSALLGSLVSRYIDLAGAIIITTYIYIEILEETRKLNKFLVDWAHPGLYTLIRKIFEDRGFTVQSLRLRIVHENKYHGDITIVARKGMPRDVAELLAEEAVEQAKKLGVDLAYTLHIAS